VTHVRGGAPDHDDEGDEAVRSADRRVVEGLRRRDETVFAEVVRAHHGALVRVARLHVPSQAIAEEVAQETWLAVINGIDRFQGRSSFKTWLFRIAVHRARSRGTREQRSLPVSSLRDGGGELPGGSGPLVPFERFRGSDAVWAGHWAAPPRRWDGAPEQRAIDGEIRAVIEDAIAELPAHQREVLVLRDVSGLSSSQVCELLGLTEGNQRVLLHRARTRIRNRLERYHE
jgi:RNA polymerase sigma-70 factor, ECF subfamily